MRHAIATLFMLLLCSQALPLKEIGKALFKSQTTEEVHPEEDGGPDDDDAIKLFTYYTGPDYAIKSIDVLAEVIAVHMHHAASLPDNHSLDIFTPPPNC